MKIEVFSGYDEHGNIIRLLEPITFQAYGKTYLIPAGYESSGYSAPRFLWGILSPAIDPKSLLASLIHDWIFDTHVLTRAQADRLFLYMLIRDGFPKWKAWVSYAGVRLFGWSHWQIPA